MTHTKLINALTSTQNAKIFCKKKKITKKQSNKHPNFKGFDYIVNKIRSQEKENKLNIKLNIMLIYNRCLYFLNAKEIFQIYLLFNIKKYKGKVNKSKVFK